MAKFRLDWMPFLSGMLLVGGAGLVAPYGNFLQVETLWRFWVGVSVMGIGFALSWRSPSIPARWFWGVAIAARLLLLPMEPGDDIWRYMWEGHIQTLGFSPYQFAPNAPELVAYRTLWWSQINHADVSAIYPPVTQLGFRLLATLSPNLYLFKLAFTLADLLVCWLLSRRFGWVQATLYAWNPMIIYTFAGGGHFDSWFILPLVAAWLMVDSSTSNPRPSFPRNLTPSWCWSALLVGISVAIKWVSLPILGFLVWRSLRQLKFKQAAGVGLIGLLPTAIGALPFCHANSCPLIPTQSVFVAYGRSAEFIPHFVAQIWPASLQANWLYSFPLALFVGWLLLRATTFDRFAESYWFGLLTITPIVHFWYFTWLVPFAVPNKNLGARLASLSAFVYFVLPSRLPDWQLTEPERLFLWLPFVLGWLLWVHSLEGTPGLISGGRSGDGSGLGSG